MSWFTTLLESNIYLDFLFDFSLNLVSIMILCYAIYYKRYHDKQAATSYMLFNVFVFTVIYVLFSSGESLSMWLGFGLFAILSIITLRSETLSKREITYFFGTLSIALINSICVQDHLFLVMCNVVILLWAYVIDHPSILRGIYSMNITLDHIPEEILSNPISVTKSLSDQFHVEIISYSISMVDYVRDTTILKISYRALMKDNNSPQLEWITLEK